MQTHHILLYLKKFGCGGSFVLLIYFCLTIPFILYMSMMGYCFGILMLHSHTFQISQVYQHSCELFFCKTFVCIKAFIALNLNHNKNDFSCVLGIFLVLSTMVRLPLLDVRVLVCKTSIFLTPSNDLSSGSSLPLMFCIHVRSGPIY